MPLYMDIHESVPEGTTALDVAGAHAADLSVQAKYGVDYRSYWVDEANGRVFCLIEAPNPEAAIAVHRRPTVSSPTTSTRWLRAHDAGAASHGLGPVAPAQGHRPSAQTRTYAGLDRLAANARE